MELDISTDESGHLSALDIISLRDERHETGSPASASLVCRSGMPGNLLSSTTGFTCLLLIVSCQQHNKQVFWYTAIGTTFKFLSSMINHQ